MSNQGKSSNPIRDLFDQFKKEKQYLDGLSLNTIGSYEVAWNAFNRYGKAELTESGVKDFMIEMIASGMKPWAANSFAASFNSFLSSLFENEHTEKHLKVPLQSLKKEMLKTYKPEEVSKIISYKPTCKVRKRIMGILFLLIDTGCRINEALTLTRKNVDFDNLLVTLKGKGSKERRVPISLECRKALYRWIQTHNHELVFCARNGSKLRYDNLRRDFLSILDAVGIEKSEGCFHAFRRFFGKQYLRNGGNILYLQKTFGHSSLEMTRVYVEADEVDLQLAHKSLWILALMIREARVYYRDGLYVPNHVLMETQEALDSEDEFGKFWRLYIEKTDKPGDRITRRELMNVWKKFTGNELMSKGEERDFTRAVVNMGIKEGKATPLNGGKSERGWVGVKLTKAVSEDLHQSDNHQADPQRLGRIPADDSDDSPNL